MNQQNQNQINNNQQNNNDNNQNRPALNNQNNNQNQNQHHNQNNQNNHQNQNQNQNQNNQNNNQIQNQNHNQNNQNNHQNQNQNQNRNNQNENRNRVQNHNNHARNNFRNQNQNQRYRNFQGNNRNNNNNNNNPQNNQRDQQNNQNNPNRAAAQRRVQREEEKYRRVRGIMYPPINPNDRLVLPIMPYNSRFTVNENRTDIENAQYSNFLQYVANQTLANSRGFSVYHFGSSQFQGVSISNSLLFAETEELLQRYLRSVIVNIANKTNFKQQNLVVDAHRRCVKVLNIVDMRDMSFEVSYSNMIMPGAPLFNYPCNPIIYKGFDKVFRIKKYGVISVTKSSNEHYFYESVRGMVEFTMNLKMINTKSMYLRYTIGENVLRSSYIGGCHFLRSDGTIYDDMRVDKYLTGSLVPVQNIIQRRYIHDYIINSRNLGPDHIRENNVIMCSTDAIYYNPDLYMSDDGVEHAHCFNCFQWQNGEYVIDKTVRYIIEPKYYRFQDHELIELEWEPNLQRNAIIIEEDSMITFQQNAIYKYKKVTMYVKGNPVPYEHPFPIFNKMVMSIGNIQNPNYKTCFQCLFNVVVNVKNKLFYVSMFAYTNRGVQRRYKPIVENIISFDNTEYLNDTCISNELLINPKKEECEIQTDHPKYEIVKEDLLIVNNPKEYINYINEPLSLCNKYAIFPRVKDIILVQSKIIKLKENSTLYKDLVNFNDPKYSLTEKDIMIEINYKYVNLVLTQFRKSSITENQVSSCINCIINLSESEKDLEPISYINAYTIVMSLIPISTMFNITIEGVVRENNFESERMKVETENEFINKKNDEIGFESLNRRKKLITQIIDLLKHIKNRPQGLIRRIYNYYNYGNNADHQIDSLIDDGNEVLNSVLLNTDKAIQSFEHKGIFNKIKYWFDVFNDSFSDKNIIINSSQNLREQLRDYFKSLLRPANVLIFFVIQIMFLIFTLNFMKFNIKSFGIQFILCLICFLLGGEIREQTISTVCDILKTSFTQIVNLSFILKYLYKLFVMSLLTMMFSSFYSYFLLLFTYSNHVFGEMFSTEIYIIFLFLLITLLCLIILIRYRNCVSLIFSIILYMLFYYYVVDLLEYFNNKFISTLFKCFLILFDFIKADSITKLNLIYDSIRLMKGNVIAYNFEVLELGSCSLNNISEFIRFLRLMKSLVGVKYNDCPEEIKNHYSERNYERVKIIELPKDDKCDNIFKTNEPFLINHNFLVSGHNIYINKPLKLHRCKRNEFESVYRQIRCGLTYDEKIMNEFINFSQKEIKKMIKNYYKEIDPLSDLITLDEYFKKLGSKKDEFIAGLQDYYEGRKLKFSYRMHNKDDEKLYLNFDDFITKSRNICAQLRMGKMLSGIPCELAMKVLHSQDWCGPGNDNNMRTNKFNKWVKEINQCGVISCDGSSFDSTQHEIMIKEIDGFLIEEVMKYHDYLFEIFNKKDLLKYAKQTEYTIFSRKGFQYKIKGTQLSGRMNTCLCNTLRSHLYVSFIIHKAHIKDSKHEVTGDDQIIFLPKFLIKRYIHYAYQLVYSDKDSNTSHGLGQIAKIFNVHEDITGAEYLSMIFIYDKEEQKVYMVRKLDRFFQLTPFTFRLRSKNPDKLNRFRLELGKDILECIYNSTKGIKIFDCYLQKAIELNFKSISTFQLHKKDINRLRKLKEKFFEEEKYKGKVVDCYYDERFNELYHQYLLKEYGITENDIDEYFDQVNKVSNIDSNIHVTIIDKLYKKTTSCKDFFGKQMQIDNNRSYVMGSQIFKNVIDWFIRQRI